MRFWLEIPWLPDIFHWEHRVCRLGPPGAARMLNWGFVVEPPRRGIIRGVMGLLAPDFTCPSDGHGA